MGGKGGGKGSGGGGVLNPNSPYGGSDRVVTRGPTTFKYGNSGAVEPAWPTTIGGTIEVNGVTYRAIRARKVKGAVRNVSSRVEFTCATDAVRAYPTGIFRYGLLKWLTGENAGVTTEVRQYANEVIPHFQLFDAMPYPIQRDDQFEVSYGCAKTRAACIQFDNTNNHRGFPDMPTEEKVLTTPDIMGTGEAKDDNGGGKK